MRCRGPWAAAAALLVVLVAAGSATGAAEEPAAASEPEADEPPRAFVGETVVVEGRASPIPTANTIAAKFPLAIESTPASVAVVDSDLLRDQSAQVLGDALANVAGVNVQPLSGVADFFVVRGLDSVAAGLVLVDGAREPETSWYQLYNIDRVEVLKGPAAFVYGGGPLAGAVNLVRRQPVAADFARVAARAGSFAERQGELDANLASAGGELAFRLAGMWRESDGYRDGRSGEDLGVNPSLTWRPTGDLAVNLTFERLDLERQPDSGLPLAGGAVARVPRTRSYQSPLDLSDQGIDRLQLDLETRLSDRLTLRDKAYWRRLDWRSRSTILNGVFPGPDGSSLVARGLLDLDDEQTIAGNQLELLMEADAGGAVHHLLAGLEVAELTDDFALDTFLLPPSDLDAGAAGEPVPPLVPLPGQQRAADADTTVLAPYVVDQIGLGDRVDLFVGLRFDRLSFSDRASGVRRRDEELSPMAGVTLAATPAVSLYASWAEAFAPPSTFAVAEDQVPEESSQAEVGAKSSLLGGRLRATVAAYRLERDNLAIPDATGITRQVGSQRSQGVEVEVAAEPAALWRLAAAYAWTDAELTSFTEVIFGGFPPAPIVVDRSGNRPAFVPEHLASAWVSRRFEGGLGLALGGRFSGRQFIAEDNAFAIGSYAVLDASGSFERGAWRCELRVENLADREILSRGFGSASVTPAPGRTFEVGLAYGL